MSSSELNIERLKELSNILGGYMETDALEAAYQMHLAVDRIEELEKLVKEIKKC